jgi:hypothetical protein
MEGGGGLVGGVWKKCEKLLKKKVAKYSGQPPPETNFSLRPSGGGRKIQKFTLGAEMASYGPGYSNMWVSIETG